MRKHFYTPIPEEDDLTDAFWQSSSDMVGIDIDETRSVVFIEQQIAPYNAEFSQYPIHASGMESGFYLLNGRFMAVDGNVYYGLIRSLKPRRILEVGCGLSTILASDAVRENGEEGEVSELICVEPYRTAILEQGNLEISELIVKKVQQVEVEAFTSLEKGDILFIDTSHVLKSGGDVQFLYCEVMPRLNPGVYVHIHDISLPKPYPRVYFDQSYFFWNEQYVLQAFLTHNSHAEVIWPGNYMMLQRPEWMMEIFPEIRTMREHYPSSEPSSFWFRTK
ncbi:MAG TPA: class I SAM-dependent methyltransferase [Anaerolineae bacterium]|nr:class I SAM-dependent methyltransferase [Anaerolineae bacterium]